MSIVCEPPTVFRPRSVDEALAHVAEGARGGRAVHALAGCTDLFVQAHERGWTQGSWVDLWPLRGELAGVRWQDDGRLELGALTTFAELQADPQVGSMFPSLAKAASQVGATQIQARATLGGNVENASPAADGVPVLMALDALVVLTSAQGVREVQLSDYYTGYRQTVRRPDELITAFVIPVQPCGPGGYSFRKVGTRAYQAITKVGLATRLHWQDGQIASARVAAVSMAATTTRCLALEAALLDLTWPLSIEQRQALRTAQAADLTPIDDIRSTAAYRAEVFHRLVCEAVEQTGAK